MAKLHFDRAFPGTCQEICLDPLPQGWEVVHNPLFRSVQKGLDLGSLAESNPSEADDVLSQLVQSAISEVDHAVEHGCLGILYNLFGASPEHSTPMQYGGLFLERDREILNYAESRVCTLIHVAPNPESYLDFVSDLPGDLFAWDDEITGVSAESMRKFRSGALATFGPGGDIRLIRPDALDTTPRSTGVMTHAN